jgi:Helix-turn-helix domain
VNSPELWALLEVEVKPTAKLVLLALAVRAGSEGRAWPTVTRLCADTGLSDRAVRYALDSLVAAGHIVLEHRPGRASVVTVTPAPRADPTPARRAPTPAPRADPTPAPRADPPRHDVHPPRHLVPKTPAPRAPRSKKELEKEVATTGSTALRPAVAGNGNGDGAAAVVHNGPAPGESWGEYRERGGR